MGMLRRLLGEPAPSQEDLQRQAGEELELMRQGSALPADAMPAADNKETESDEAKAE